MWVNIKRITERRLILSVKGLSNPRAFPEFALYVFKALQLTRAKPPFGVVDFGAGLGMLGCVLKVMAPQPVELTYHLMTGDNQQSITTPAI